MFFSPSPSALLSESESVISARIISKPSSPHFAPALAPEQSATALQIRAALAHDADCPHPLLNAVHAITINLIDI